MFHAKVAYKRLSDYVHASIYEEGGVEKNESKEYLRFSGRSSCVSEYEMSSLMAAISASSERKFFSGRI